MSRPPGPRRFAEATVPGYVSAVRGAQLRAANEALVLAAMHAETVAESARIDLNELAQAAQHDAQLAEAQKMEAIGVLASGIAHDFNNVLAGILGNLALAQQAIGADHPAMRSLQQAEKASRHGRHLVQQILSFARRQPKTLADLVLGDLVDETVDLLRSALPAGVKLDVTLAAEPLHVLADATQIEQVLVNLCTNAWQAMEGNAGCVSIALKAIALDARAAERIGSVAARYARLSVIDDGAGMDPQTQVRLFEPLFTTKALGKGTGLGLSIAHRIVKAHGGVITVESAKGTGSRFDVYLPLHEPTAGAAVDAVAASLPTSGGEHILYVDDDDVMLVLVERFLTTLGYRVTCHRSANAAIAAVRAQPDKFDVVVTDLNMPECSGLDVAKEVASIRSNLPVMITSGHIPEQLYAEARELGVRALLNKENTLEDLGALLRLVLSGAFQVR